MTTTTFTSPAELRDHLQVLYVERALAESEGLLRNAHYREDLEAEIAGTRSAYVGAAVTEIATLRAQLSGRLLG